MAIDLEPAGIGSTSGDAFTDPVATNFHVDVRDDLGTIMLGLHGEADLGTAPILAHALAQASEIGHAKVVLDATGLEFIDAHCIGIIAGARTRLRELERDLVLSSPPALARRVLSILGMEDLIVHPRC